MATTGKSLMAAICVLMAGALGAVPVVAHHSTAQSAKTKKWPKNLQCVPYAREMSGVRIFGDAHTWWGQAKGRYARGDRPIEGAVMAFKPHRGSRLGHVAYVSKIVDSRNILISHSNWSLINGRRGQIETNVPARDVSPNNDWSEVRIWYHQTGALGGTHWPLHQADARTQSQTSSQSQAARGSSRRGKPNEWQRPGANSLVQEIQRSLC